MRRPICLFGLAFAVLLMIWIAAAAHEAETYDKLDKEEVTVAGFVEWKEERISAGRKTLVVTLKNATVLKPDRVSDLTQALTESQNIQGKEIQTDSIEKYYNQNKRLLVLGGAEEIEGLLCYMEAENMPNIGSFIVARGQFRAFEHASNPGEFDAADYYRIVGQQGRVMRCECLAQSGAYDKFREGLCRLKEYLSFLLDACYPDGKASVMRAMLLGEKGVLEENVKSLYRQNGIIHILAISGLHLSILGMGLYKLFRKMRIPVCVSVIVSVLVMYCYGTMTGMGVSVMRAFVMFCFHLGAQLLGRTYDMLTAMAVAAVSMLIQQPFYLEHSGFLFSYGAICGIGLLLPEAEENMLCGSRFVKSLFAGIIVSVSTLPVYLMFYYEFPPYSVLLNLIVIPCMSVILVDGILTLSAAACSLWLGKRIALPSVFLLDFYQKCCETCMELPGHDWVAGCPRGWQLAGFVLILTGLVLWNKKLTKLQFWQGILLALMVLTLRVQGGLEIVVVDVGQGDCIYLSENRGGRYLIDGGSSSESDVAKYRIIPFLKYKGADRLDAVFVTHPDSDHENGIMEILEHYEENGIEIGALILPDVAEECKSDEYKMLAALAESKGVPVFYIYDGRKIQSGKLQLTCLHPAKGYLSDANEYSTVLHVNYGAFEALFTGDLEGDGERLVQEKMREICGKGGIELLKVAHHGSRNSTGAEFLNTVSPALSVISCGKDNRYGHPHSELLERLSMCGTVIYRTPEDGAVTVWTDGERVRVSGFLD